MNEVEKLAEFIHDTITESEIDVKPYRELSEEIKNNWNYVAEQVLDHLDD